MNRDKLQAEVVNMLDDMGADNECAYDQREYDDDVESWEDEIYE